MESVRRIIALIIKEFLTLLKDPKSRTVVIGPPIIQLILFGYAATFDLTDIPYAFEDLSRSIESREFLAGVSGSPYFHLVGEVRGEPVIREMIDSRRVRFVLRIGRNFAKDLKAGRGAPVQVLLDGRNSNTAGIIGNYLSNVVGQYNTLRLTRAGRASPSLLVSRIYYNENALSRQFFVPGIVGVIAMVVTLLVTALSVAREREHGTFDQLLVTPLSPMGILVGKAAPGLVIGLLESTLIMLAAVFWFEVPLRGNLGLLYLGLFFFIFAAVGVGLMVSSLSVTMQQALLGSFLFLMPSVLLSGFATPIANMTEVVQWITLVNPLRYVLVLIRGVFIENSPTYVLLMQVWPLALIGLACMALAVVMFRNRIY
ncbi:Inner membrane transport permease YbhR [Pseudodesulfovibrio hydrargyri]|uniref:Inner membrane transport permease YbhR n=1 Tax=Pseudodesulfovibrio hydrargyri TaxID=2125990 RepID=A0A1J5MS06_9BACT|nr:ABC transporter permease [Pseudodesulfovibrio hydrargyri]OIQ49382.1 Inner membrane transport permease YbhR [Pseudodesulfovibrio hydrargyri]